MLSQGKIEECGDSATALLESSSVDSLGAITEKDRLLVLNVEAEGVEACNDRPFVPESTGQDYVVATCGLNVCDGFSGYWAICIPIQESFVARI